MPNRIESKELVYDGKIVKGYDILMRMDDGRTVRRDFLHYRGATVVLPVLADGRIVLIRNWRFAVEEHLWELPAGLIDEGEAPAACAARELAEETGYTAGRIKPLGTFYTGPGTMDERMHAFLATDLTAGRQELEIYEEITVEQREEAEVRRMILSGELHDAKTISTLCIYWLSRGQANSRQSE